MSLCSANKDLWRDTEFQGFPESFKRVTLALNEYYKSPRSYPSSEGAPSFVSDCEYGPNHEGDTPEERIRLQVERDIEACPEYKDKWALTMSPEQAQTNEAFFKIDKYFKALSKERKAAKLTSQLGEIEDDEDDDPIDPVTGITGTSRGWYNTGSWPTDYRATEREAKMKVTIDDVKALGDASGETIKSKWRMHKAQKKELEIDVLLEEKKNMDKVVADYSKECNELQEKVEYLEQCLNQNARCLKCFHYENNLQNKSQECFNLKQQLMQDKDKVSDWEANQGDKKRYDSRCHCSKKWAEVKQELKEKVRAKQMEINELNFQIETKNDTIKRLSGDIKMCDRENTLFREEKANLQSLKDEVEMLRDKIASAKDQSDREHEYRTANKKLKATLAHKDEEIRELKANYEKQLAEKDKELEGKDTKLSHKDFKVAHFEKKKKKLQEKIDRLEEELKLMQTKCQDKDKIHDTSKRKFNDVRDKLKEENSLLAKQIEQNKEKIKDYYMEGQQYRQELEQLKLHMESRELIIKDQTEELDELKSFRSPSGQYSFHDLYKKNKALESEMQSIRKSSQKQNAYIQHLENFESRFKQSHTDYIEKLKRQARLAETSFQRQFDHQKKVQDAENAKYEKLIQELKSDLELKEKELKKKNVESRSSTKKSPLNTKPPIPPRSNPALASSEEVKTVRPLPPRPSTATRAIVKKEKNVESNSSPRKSQEKAKPLKDQPFTPRSEPALASSSDLKTGRPLPPRPPTAVRANASSKPLAHSTPKNTPRSVNNMIKASDKKLANKSLPAVAPSLKREKMARNKVHSTASGNNLRGSDKVESKKMSRSTRPEASKSRS